MATLQLGATEVGKLYLGTEVAAGRSADFPDRGPNSGILYALVARRDDHWYTVQSWRWRFRAYRRPDGLETGERCHGVNHPAKACPTVHGATWLDGSFWRSYVDRSRRVYKVLHDGTADLGVHGGRQRLRCIRA